MTPFWVYLFFFRLISGLLPPGTQFDLFRGTAAMKQDEEDMYPTTLGHTIKVGFIISVQLAKFILFFRWKHAIVCFGGYLVSSNTSCCFAIKFSEIPGICSILSVSVHVCSDITARSAFRHCSLYLLWAKRNYWLTVVFSIKEYFSIFLSANLPVEIGL